MKLLNKGHPFCKSFVASIKGYPLLRGFIWLKITSLYSCHLALIHGVVLVQGGALLRVFTVNDFINI